MGNGKNERFGLWIPIEILLDQNLDWTNKALLSEIYSLCDLKHGCFASDKYFGKFLGVGRTAVNKRVNWLKQEGYIITRNEYQNNLCVGRVIMRSSSDRKHTHVPKEDKPSSIEIQEVVPELDSGSSVENTTNSLTNSEILIQKLIQHPGEENKIPGHSMNKYLTQRFEQLAVELVEKSSLGENVFYYTERETVDFIRDAVCQEEFNIIYPLLMKIIDIDERLHGK